MLLCIQTIKGNVNLVSAYAPTLGASPDMKDSLYEALEDTVRLMNIDELLFILGDFNTRVGNQQTHWPQALGYHGICKMNENGQRLLELCTINDLTITNIFALKDQYKVLWCRPRSKHWHQTDFILARRIDLNCVRDTQSFHSVDCDMDHTLVVSKLSIKTKLDTILNQLQNLQ